MENFGNGKAPNSWCLEKVYSKPVSQIYVIDIYTYMIYVRYVLNYVYVCRPKNIAYSKLLVASHSKYDMETKASHLEASSEKGVA